MRAFLTLTRRELASYFLSFAGYVIIAAAAFMMGLSILILCVQIAFKPMPVPLNELFFGTWYPWLVLIPVAPLITMRTFALEKATGTYETLMTAPVRDGHVVLAKFTAAVMFYAIMWLPLIACLLTVQHFSINATPPDYTVLGATYFGLLLVGGLLASFGCLASSLTQSQAIAAIIALGFNLVLFILSFLLSAYADTWRGKLGPAGRLLDGLAITDQMEDFARGVLDTRSIVAVGTMMVFFLILTLRVIESRRWK